jgi:hypothetical protein
VDAQGIGPQPQGIFDGVKLPAGAIHRPQHCARPIDAQHQPHPGQIFGEAGGGAVAGHHRIHPPGDNLAEGALYVFNAFIRAGNHAVVAGDNQRPAIGLENSV